MGKSINIPNSDGQRADVVDYVVLHHSAGSFMVNASDLAVQDLFDRVGKSRGYANRKRSYHKHPSRNKETFAQAHFALRKYTKDGNKYGWRLTELIKFPYQNVAWHAANWKINQRSIGIEVCGNYTNKKLPNEALLLIADTFRDHDRSIGGKLKVTGHRQYIATQCPGKIFDQRKTVIDMINNPEKWHEEVFGVKVEPEPTEEPKNENEATESDISTNYTPNMTDKSKTIGEHVKSSLSWSSSTQAVTYSFGVIFAYNNPEMPIEVILAYTGLFGWVFNNLSVIIVKLLDKFSQKK